MTLVDHSSAPRMVNPLYTVSLHGALVSLSIFGEYTKLIFTGCAEAEHPGVYAQVNAPNIYEWIVAHMGDNGYTD